VTRVIKLKKIDQTLNRLTHSERFMKQYENIRKEILSHPKIITFLKANSSSIDEGMIERSLMKLYEFTTQNKDCSHCQSVSLCKNMMQGYVPRLEVQGKSIEIVYERCEQRVKEESRRERERLIQSLYVPRDILSASLSNIDIDTKSKMEAIKAAHGFIEEYMKGEKPKGLYLHGSFGVGKTYLLGAIANNLADKHVSTLLVYVPDFLRESKAAIGDNSLNEKIDFVKKAPILMLDDIGAETMTSWTRDEVLGPILQHRMADQMPTFFSSNFNFNELEHHLTFSQKGEEERMKAARILERIKTLATPYHLDGHNRRT